MTVSPQDQGVREPGVTMMIEAKMAMMFMMKGKTNITIVIVILPFIIYNDHGDDSWP